MDKLIITGMTVAVPGLLLFFSMQATGKTGNSAIWSGLQNLGGPFQLLGGLFFLVAVGLVVNGVINRCMDTVWIKIYQKRRQLEPTDQLLAEIDKLPLSYPLKIQLKWVVLHNETPNFPVVQFLGRHGFKIGVCGVILLSLLGYFGQFFYLLDLTSHFKLQYLIGGIIGLFYFAFKRRKPWIIVSLICILINFAEIAPWYWANPAIATPVQSSIPIKVLQSNLLFQNKHYEKLLSFVRQETPDIAAFMEVKGEWKEQLETLRDILPYAVLKGDIALYSSLPLKRVYEESLDFKKRGVIAQISLPEKVLSIVVAHTNIPLSKNLFKNRNQQLEAIADYVAPLNNPALVLGDFNISLWSPIYREFVQNAHLQNARSGFGIMPTWPSFNPLLSIPIDHCFVNREIQVFKTRKGPNIGSDHLPLVTDLGVLKE
ncbi:endonuclease/exonuclease/phosphatase family protein [Laspinema olomoucense]|uniref:Endonuclease/exonuclease/phosphatase family protein n=1 Tax=Laspinema olomoucense D3b TaxID=2953688 RepID=A0ABT2N180_9CYAN|nr:MULTISPECIES: endonuclease/exonuclease/phosphatase family protein [unclassified Laspinema]MCT7971963.1 endonuclease/exonuclease/phosphatase family protein [Laspinema sp. D3d]MCT7976434.1 endonuclease/exonuclease/phosphatase family protein [Laspinema sp. D3b]